MHSSVLSLCSGFGLFYALSIAASIPAYFERHPITRRNLIIHQIQQELGSQLSNTSSIFGPEDGRFALATSRQSETIKPRVQLVVETANEADVATVVRSINTLTRRLDLPTDIKHQIKYCNANSIDFLARSGGHGWTETLNIFNGIQISMQRLDDITIHPSGKSAWLGGGLLVGNVVQYLWDRGFITTTGTCDCVGMLGSGLGGGHGRQQGFYGMVSDNFRQFNVVLADGSTIRVNATHHDDLFWGMRGAGQNFGLVTSYEMNIYPRGPETWHYHNYIWQGNKLTSVFEALNRFHNNGSTPVNMAVNFGNIQMNSTISTEDPVLWWTFAYRGNALEAETLLEPFNAIEAVWDEQGDVPYPQISNAQRTAVSDPLCSHGRAHIRSTAGLQVYNLTAERLIYEGFRRQAAEDPELAASAAILHEGYSTAGVKSIDPVGSAYPFRADNLLMLFDAAVAPEDGARQDAARAWASEVRGLWDEGQPGRTPNIYVNYASGQETSDEMYGHESWRIEKLRCLKAKFDPFNRFRFYNPIIKDNIK